MCHRSKFRQNLPNSFLHIEIFQFLRLRMSVILDFQIFQYLVAQLVGRTNVHCRTKFNQNWSNGCRDIACNVFLNGGSPPSWIFQN